MGRVCFHQEGAFHICPVHFTGTRDDIGLPLLRPEGTTSDRPKRVRLHGDVPLPAPNVELKDLLGSLPIGLQDVRC